MTEILNTLVVTPYKDWGYLVHPTYKGECYTAGQVVTREELIEMRDVINRALGGMV